MTDAERRRLAADPARRERGMQLDAFALTVAGCRSNNEDAVCARPELGLFVFDG